MKFHSNVIDVEIFSVQRIIYQKIITAPDITNMIISPIIRTVDIVDIY